MRWIVLSDQLPAAAQEQLPAPRQKRQRKQWWRRTRVQGFSSLGYYTMTCDFASRVSRVGSEGRVSREAAVEVGNAVDGVSGSTPSVLSFALPSCPSPFCLILSPSVRSFPAPSGPGLPGSSCAPQRPEFLGAACFCSQGVGGGFQLRRSNAYSQRASRARCASPSGRRRTASRAAATSRSAWLRV